MLRALYLRSCQYHDFHFALRDIVLFLLSCRHIFLLFYFADYISKIVGHK